MIKMFHVEHFKVNLWNLVLYVCPGGVVNPPMLLFISLNLPSPVFLYL